MRLQCLLSAAVNPIPHGRKAVRSRSQSRAWVPFPTISCLHKRRSDCFAEYGSVPTPFLVLQSESQGPGQHVPALTPTPGGQRRDSPQDGPTGQEQTMSPGHSGQCSNSHVTHSASFHLLSLSFLFLFSKNRKRTHDGSAPNLHSTPNFQARSQAAAPHRTEKRRERELHTWSPHAACSPLSTHRRATRGQGPNCRDPQIQIGASSSVSGWRRSRQPLGLWLADYTHAPERTALPFWTLALYRALC